MVNHEGFYGDGRGIVEEDGLRLTTYTYSEDGYRIGFSRGKLMATLSDGRTELVPVLEQLTTSLDQLSAYSPEASRDTLQETGGTVVTEASLHAEKPVVISPEQKCAEIPIPGERQPLDMVVESGTADISDRHQSHG